MRPRGTPTETYRLPYKTNHKRIINSLIKHDSERIMVLQRGEFCKQPQDFHFIFKRSIS